MVHLRGLTNLQTLNMPRAGITDAGLRNLEGLTHLKGLDVTGSAVTDEGLMRLKRIAAELEGKR